MNEEKFRFVLLSKGSQALSCGTVRFAPRLVPSPKRRGKRRRRLGMIVERYVGLHAAFGKKRYRMGIGEQQCVKGIEPKRPLTGEAARNSIDTAFAKCF